MLLLGIETSTKRVGVVVASEEGMLGRVEVGGHADAGPPRHAERLAPAIEYCFGQLGTTLDHVSAIAVGVGPGMFTG
ncbi:MAG TPA: tRNA (adenosine(37)-N6)-threonylcarbamoyltransferase complex dimerization subunit type 1 TsaB, partial [Acidimicrobiia bacterium]|nr:tRNA (adenosine(37)-N6)-threonylcarbamoyltransferase complex dimerization subunit type 1 TsaB [Acidimicrobiia bacterium]